MANFELIIVLFYALVLAAILGIAIPARVKFVKSERELKKRFSEGMIRGLESGSIASLDDVKILYAGCCSLSGVADYNRDLNRDLTEFHARLVSRDPQIVGETIDASQVKGQARQVIQLIDRLTEMAPLAELPKLEGTILKDVSSFLENNDHEGVKRKLSELSVAIRTRHEELTEAIRWKNTSFLIALASFIFTILFGIYR